MAQVKKTVIINHSAGEMFLLVDDVLKYPEFLPWCGGVDLIHQDDQSTTATLHIAYHGLHQNFTTQNSKSFPSLMTIQLDDDLVQPELKEYLQCQQAGEGVIVALL